MRTEKLETEKWRENQFKIIIQLLVETSETLPIFLSPIFLSKIFAKMTDFYLYYSARRATISKANSSCSVLTRRPRSSVADRNHTSGRCCGNEALMVWRLICA